MTQEYKDLLLKDLSARAPYGVIIEHDGKLSKLDAIFMCDSISISSTSLDNKLSYNLDLDEFKPYLYPLSSMTIEQKEEEKSIKEEFYYSFDANGNIYTLQDFYDKNHIDYRGLIEKGLALEAPEGMYNIKRE